MESLICSNPISTKLPRKPFLRPLHRPHQLSFAPAAANPKRVSSPPLTCVDPRRFDWIRCRYASSSSAVTPEFRNTRPGSVSERVDFRDGSESQQAAELIPDKQKAVRAIVLLSAICVLFIHPLIASPALAFFQNAAKSGGSVAASGWSQAISNELLSSGWTGFFAGCLHTLSGPDHLAALAPLSIGRGRMESAAVGALWGCGHDAGQLIFGLLFLLLKDRLHIEIIRTWGTRVVGFTLLLIGAMGIREASEVHTPCVATLENGYEGKSKIGFATFATGIIHGLQPDALMMVLPALALPSRVAGAAFLLMFLVGTVFAMGSYTVFIGSCSQALKERVPRITEKLTWASSLIAIALGFAILITQFFGFSLY
ncbi:unnamed protein product [Cuscuta campestris]|uniref:Urease accessory protein UreH-like transmembrane domain-containing protein n=2 Tax=Cuscuta sect. Cleistogrammica TaxID=1824901 RepID=A0A484L7J3_9ASTE|nr:hypothetical protein DM860_005866 [Cuscuta australis]VFQ72317.1 unnamed protein product [Cuscuta campestris]